MSKSSKNLFLLVLISIFFVVGFIGFKNSLPEEKNPRIYGILEEYFPYTIEKRFGGLAIVYSDGREKEKPKNADIFHITDKIEKDWGKEHLKLEGNILIILDSNKNELRKVELNSSELNWLKNYFDI